MQTRDQFQTVYEQGPDAAWEVIAALQAALESQQQQVAALTARVKELEDRLGTDSHNSSKPPSSDGLKKQTISLRVSTGRKPGGQKGHPGRTLSFAEHPDEVLIHAPAHCACCGRTLADIPVQMQQRRQVFDLAPLSLRVTEHRKQGSVCPDCGQQNSGTFPVEVTQPTQYGPRVKALGVYLLDYQLLPYERIAELFADLFGAPLSAGTLFAAQQSASASVEPVLACIRAGVCQSAVGHFDETGLRVQGSLHWLHVGSTATLTYYTWHKQRGKIGMDAAGVLPHFSGTALHDGWASYLAYGCSHAFCNAHHLRELTALYEQDKQEWAKTLRSLLAQIKQAVDAAQQQGQTHLSTDQQADFEARYRALLMEGYAANPPPIPIPGKRGRKKQNRARNLLDRLQRFGRETLAFMYDFAVPFDNNQAERDVRMMKVQQKVSGCFRSAQGADAFCRIRSYISTLRKQRHNVLTALEYVFRTEPIYPEFSG